MAEFHKINLLRLHVGMWERGIILENSSQVFVALLQ